VNKVSVHNDSEPMLDTNLEVVGNISPTIEL